MNKIPMRILTFLVASLTLFLSGVSLIKNDIYTERINRITRYELMGMDLATALVSALFIIILIRNDYNKIKTRVLSVGFLLYQFYVYSYYSFSGITSDYYLLYVTVAGLSFYLIAAAIFSMKNENRVIRAAENYPGKSISVYLILSVALVGCIEIKDLVVFTIISDVRFDPYYAFYVLDLSMIFPLIVISAILNYRKSNLGYILTGVSLIKIVTILPGAVIFNDLFHRIFKGYFLDLTFDIIAAIITATGFVFLMLFLKTTKEDAGTLVA